MSGGGGENVEATRRVEVFRPGSFTAMNGSDYTFSEADVAAIASSYDADSAPAPVVVGHPKHDDPAFGWAKGFSVNDDGVLVAEIGDLSPAFVSAVEQGRYRKVSMKFFAPGAANNPAPGTYYPRHIGFLGGAAPAVSGLAPVQFSDASADELIEIEFGEAALEDVASLFRKLREFIIDKFSRDEADQAVPEYLIRWVDDAADGPNDAASFTENEDHDMSGSTDALDARQAQLEQREKALNHTENLAFVEGLVSDNKLLPALRPSAVALLDQLVTDQGDEISFADGAETKSLTPTALFKSILSALPEQVPLGSPVPNEDEAPTVAFAAPDGMRVDQDALAVHGKALAYQRDHPGTDYLDAVQAVQEG